MKQEMNSIIKELDKRENHLLKLKEEEINEVLERFKEKTKLKLLKRNVKELENFNSKSLLGEFKRFCRNPETQSFFDDSVKKIVKVNDVVKSLDIKGVVKDLKKGLGEFFNDFQDFADKLDYGDEKAFFDVAHEEEDDDEDEYGY